MGSISKNWSTYIVLFFLIVGAGIRFFLYGDLRLSIGTSDTSGYIISSRVPLVSWEMFTGARLFTTNLLYKMANGSDCKLIAISIPAAGNEEFRAIQPCFDKIAVLQNLLSIIFWCIFTWFFASRLTNHFTKILAAILIPTFAFVPQIAEWDSILGSESLTLSLLALLLSLMVEIVFRIAEEGIQIPSKTKLIIILFLAVFALWVLVRDVNLFATPLTMIMILVLFIYKPFRRAGYLITSLLVLTGLFILGVVSTIQSPRLDLTIGHALETYILPYPTRVDFFKKFGMPELNTPAYLDWHRDKASLVYMLFLASHPGFVVTTMLDNSSYFTNANVQPYFKSPELTYHNILITIGEFLHAKSSLVYLLDIIFVTSLFINAVKCPRPRFVAWAWFAIWIYLVSTVMLFLNFWGDISGVLRHIFPPVAMFRLLLWLFTLIILDIMLEGKKTNAASRIEREGISE